MAIRFQGIYRVKPVQVGGPMVYSSRHYRYHQQILAINTKDELIKSNPNTAAFVVPGAGDIFMFRDDDRGNHFTQYNQIRAPYLKAKEAASKALDEARNGDLSQYMPLQDQRETFYELSTQTLVDLINQAVDDGSLGKIQVEYTVEPRARRFNGAQWANGAYEPGSPRVRSAFPIQRVSELA